ncbi:hypothetical protein BGZ95_007871, partial [Linnemannia exigua]
RMERSVWSGPYGALPVRILRSRGSQQGQRTKWHQGARRLTQTGDDDQGHAQQDSRAINNKHSRQSPYIR